MNVIWPEHPFRKQPCVLDEGITSTAYAAKLGRSKHYARKLLEQMVEEGKAVRTKKHLNNLRRTVVVLYKIKENVDD